MNQLIENVSKRLKIARIASDFKTAKEFAEKNKIPVTTYSQHERGVRALSIENLINYAALTKIDPSWLLTGEGNPCESEDFPDLEKRIIEEQEKLWRKGELDASMIPLASFEKRYSNVNVILLKKILEEILPLLKEIPASKTSDAIEFCFDLYNKIITTNSNDQEKENLVRICLESFFKGLGIIVNKEVVLKVAKIA